MNKAKLPNIMQSLVWEHTLWITIFDFDYIVNYRWMDVEATIEDLEAQAYFASFSGGSLGKSETSVVQVCFKELAELTCYLKQPLLGRDFIAGFPSKFAPQWMIVPLSEVTSLIELTGTISQTEISMSELIRNSLLEAKVILRPTAQSPIVSGVIKAILGSLVRIQSVNKQVELFPLANIHSLAVEKLSGQ
jgi:hypothetical protein